jgi:hypothetical protein
MENLEGRGLLALRGTVNAVIRDLSSAIHLAARRHKRETDRPTA